jgi:hypothetical protein
LKEFKKYNTLTNAQSRDYISKIKNIVKRILLLADIASLKQLKADEADKIMVNENKKSIDELHRTIDDLKAFKSIKSTSIQPTPKFENMPKDLKNEIASYLGGMNKNDNYKSKYIKYKNKYLELKNKLH